MNTKAILVALAIVASGVAAQPAAAQECPCNCYWSSDCEPGNFCNYGNLSIEDSCFWKQPKPQGNIGGGCTEDFNDWGQCDGICTENQAVTYYADEDLGRLVDGLELWSEALTWAASNGGGLGRADLVAQVNAIEYREERMADSMWRTVVEVFTMTRGDDFVLYPAADEFLSVEARANDLSDRPELILLGNLAVQALIAEVVADGSGQPFFDEIAALGLDAYLDTDVFEQACPGVSSNLECLALRIGDMGDAIGRGGRDADGNPDPGVAFGTGPCGEPLPQICHGDTNNDDMRNVDDIINVILDWGHVGPPAPPHRGDTDRDGDVDVDDVVMVVTNWGPCQP